MKQLSDQNTNKKAHTHTLGKRGEKSGRDGSWRESSDRRHDRGVIYKKRRKIFFHCAQIMDISQAFQRHFQWHLNMQGGRVREKEHTTQDGLF